MSSLRSTILQHAIPLIPTHSFTRQALLRSLPSLKQDHPDYRPALEESVVDTIFGSGQAPAQSLTAAWEEDGLASMQGKDARQRLKSRLSHSAVVGEHLVEVSAPCQVKGIRRLIVRLTHYCLHLHLHLRCPCRQYPNPSLRSSNKCDFPRHIPLLNRTHRCPPPVPLHLLHHLRQQIWKRQCGARQIVFR